MDLLDKAKSLIGGQAGGDAGGDDMMGKVQDMAKKFLAERKGASTDPEVAGDGTVEGDIAALKAAMKGFGTDEQKLIGIIFRRPREHLLKLLEADSGLLNQIKRETSGTLQECIECVFETYAEARAQRLYAGMTKRGTDESCVIDCLCPCTPSEVEATRAAYKKMGLAAKMLPLDFRVKFETSGQLQRCFEAVLDENRPESGVDQANLDRDVEVFHEATAGKVGTDEDAVSELVRTRSVDHIRALNDAYKAKYGKTAFDVVRRECSGQVEAALLATCMPKEYYVAHRLRESIKGIGTDEESLIRNVMIHSPETIRKAAAVMTAEYGENLVQRVTQELSSTLEDCIATYVAFSVTGQ